MSNDTNRLLQYMYGELDEVEAEQMEEALTHRPDLFDEWFAFHEVKRQLDAKAPARPDAAVVDQIVGDAGQAAASSTAPAHEADAFTRGDGVPQHDAGAGCTVTVPPARRAERPASTRSASEGPAKNPAPTPPTSATASPSVRNGAAVPWALTLVLAAVLLLNGAPWASGPEGSAAIGAADLPAWDTPTERAALHRQASVLQTRMSDPSAPLSSVSHSVTR
ncbi:hypothetical protein CRI93_07140 [Longimonas halophila]|uniref:Uncharacterized protein n=1 Tax=Longimonas halophila TaxID=1469170 RepID=A0A2H3P674_9BACT|nr:hypothetical protein [Longimonas halophila]PEN07752.1 hypothetical protein CRI93_07140 [Longimonas halophila]